MLDAAPGEGGAGGQPGRPGTHHRTVDHRVARSASRHVPKCRRPGQLPSGTLVPALFLDEPCRLQQHDPVPLGPHDAVLTQVAQDPHDDLPNRARGVRRLLLADLDGELAVLPDCPRGCSPTRAEARSSRCRATRCRTVAKAPPGIS
jgi:hypothetical protein